MAARVAEVVLVAVSDPAEAEEVRTQLASCGWQVLAERAGAVALTGGHSRSVTLVITSLHPGEGVPQPAVPEGPFPSGGLSSPPEAPAPRGEALSARALTRFVQRVQILANASVAVAPEPPAERPQEISLGTYVQLWSQTGVLSAGCSAIVAEVGPASLRVINHPSHDCLQHVSLGTPVRVSFPCVHGWAEFMSRVAGFCVRGPLAEVTLALPQHVVYRPRRRWPRVAALLSVRAWPTSHPDRAGVMIAGQVVDIGHGGISAGFLGPLPSSQDITLAIDAGDGRELRVGARATWYRPPIGAASPVTHRYGFQFVDLARGTRARVRGLVSRLRLAQTQAGLPHRRAPSRADGAERVELGVSPRSHHADLSAN